MKLIPWKSANALDVLFRDDFSRPDGGAVGGGWFDKDGTCRLEGERLVIQDGWISQTRKFPQDLRLEFKVRLDGPSSFGAFLSGAEGFWNGYQLVAGDRRLLLRRLDVMVAFRQGVDLPPGREHSLFLERRGARIRAGVGGKVLIEALDLDPLPEEGYDRLGLHTYRCAVRFGEVTVLRVPREEEAPEIAEGRRLAAAGGLEPALDRFRRAARRLSGEGRMEAGLQAVRCLARLARPAEALGACRQLGSGKVPAWAGPHLTRYTLESSLLAGDGPALDAAVKRIESEPRYFLDRRIFVGTLSRLDWVWSRRALLQAARGDRMVKSLGRAPDFWENGWAARVLLKFAWLALGPGEFRRYLELVEATGGSFMVSEEALRAALFVRAEELGFHGGRAQARGLWKRISPDAAEGPDRLASCPFFVLAEALDRGTPRPEDPAVRAPVAALRAAEAAWALGREMEASALLQWILARPEIPGHVGAQAVLDLAALRLSQGDLQAAEAAGSQLRGPWRAEVWAGTLADLLSGRTAVEDWGRHPGWDAYWTLGPARTMPLLAGAALLRARKEDELASRTLEWVRDISYPWEPSRAVAARWLSGRK